MDLVFRFQESRGAVGQEGGLTERDGLQLSRCNTSMPEAWVYIDESQAPSSEGCEHGQPFWVAALSVEQPIPASLADEALACLAGDPDAIQNQHDIRTLDRGYFHASLDSRNAHSHLCTAIRNSRMNAKFRAFLWYFDREGGSSRNGSRLHRLGVLGSAVATLDLDYDAAHLIVAKREGSFDQEDANQWPAYCEDNLVTEAIRHGCRPVNRIPVVELVEASTPGIQVCDFILWAAQRRSRGRPDWSTRLGCLYWAEGGVPGVADQGYATDFGVGLSGGRWPT